MQTIGERLEEARKRKGLSIREAAEATKIRGDYLQKFEANSFDLDLPPLYIRGFVRSYARYLELDPERFLAEYDSVVASEGRAPRRESREVYGRVEFGGEAKEGASTGGSQVDQAVMLKYGVLGGGALVVIVVVIVLINVLSSHSSPKPATTAAQPATTQQPADAGAQTLTFTAADATRLKIVSETTGAVIFNDGLARGETKSFRKTGTFLITVEDRTKLRMEVNGRATDIPQFAAGNYGRFRLD
ncbi:MAG: helix-turn-helix domain-containing protein [Opitutae bacterium]|nr:helix-turn-helix domain-containing protein [Opitutae bacterium]